MSAWLISIIGIVFIGVLIDVLIDENKEMKYIKSIYSLIVLYVIISPIYDFVSNGEISLDKISSYSTNETYITEVFTTKTDYYKSTIMTALINSGYSVDSVSLYTEYASIYKISKINIDVSSDFSNIDEIKIKELVIDIVGEVNISIY